MTSFTSRQILTSQTVGERLAKIRHGSRLSLAQVSRSLGIKQIYLEAIENGLYNDLPGDIYCLEFIKSYARFLRANPETAAREYTEERTAERRSGQTISRPRVNLGSNRALLVKIAAAGALAVGLFYVLTVSTGFARPPQLEVFSPAAYYEAAEGRVLLSGKTAPEARLFVNGQSLPVDGSGAFNEIFHLPPALSLLKIAARDKYGRERVVWRTVRIGGQVAGASTTRDKF